MACLRRRTCLAAETRLAAWPEIDGRTAAHYAAREAKPLTNIVVDEAQDLGVAELRFLAAVAPPTPYALFFAGDLGQRIFQQPFSWKELGVDVRGRSSTLSVNYRTSYRSRQMADRLLPNAVRDVDVNADQRERTVSIFNGPSPEIQLLDSQEAEIAAVSASITRSMSDGLLLAETASSSAHATRCRAPGLLPRQRDCNGSNCQSVMRTPPDAS